MREVLEMSRANMGLIEAHVADVPAEQMCARPTGAPGHPAWQLGHLSFVRASLLRAFGPPPEFPNEWTDLFRTGSRPTTDPTGYPAKEALLGKLKSLNEQVLAVVSSLPEQALDGPNPVESLRGRLPTVRMLVALLLTTHDGYHVGQLAAWRGAMKLRPIL
jgi:hypothetical protein